MSFPNNVYNQSSGQNEISPRRPNITTESRVLNIIHNRHEQLDQSSPQQIVNEATQSTIPQQPHPSQQQQSSQQLTLPQMPSQLSVNAKEFFPRAQNVSSGYNNEEALRLSANAAEFVPRAPEEFPYYNNENYREDYNFVNSFNNMQVQDGYHHQDATGGGLGGPIVERFNNALHVLNMNPGNMKDYLQPICDMIESSSPQDSQNIMDAMVEGLFEQSIVEANFRYTGARICQFLNRNLRCNAQFSGFYKVFMRRCQQEYGKREELIAGTPEDCNRLVGLSMFMAEIFLNVQIENPDGSLARIQFLPKTLIDLIQTLLSHPTELEVKCCCQLLKLSGALIEDVAKESPDLCGVFEDIFCQLASLRTRVELPNNTRVLVGSVIQLKENNWNRSTSSPPKKSVFSFASDQTSFQQEGPVFYTQNGDVCTGADAGFPEDNSYVLNEEEEAAFLEWQAEQGGLSSEQTRDPFDDTGYDSYHLDEIPDEGGMGEELEAAFEEFLQEQSTSMSSHHRHHQGAQGSGGTGYPAQSFHHQQQQYHQQHVPIPHQHLQQQYPMYQAPQIQQDYSRFPYAQAMRNHHAMDDPTGASSASIGAPQAPPPPSGQPPSSQNQPYQPGNDRFHFTKR